MKKLLRIEVDGIKLFNKKLEVDFYAKNRVSYDDEYTKQIISHNNLKVSALNTIAFTGINASGKTKTLEILSFVLILLQGRPVDIALNRLHLKELINAETGFSISAYFLEKNNVYRLDTSFRLKGQDDEEAAKVIISSERLLCKNINLINAKKNLLIFDDSMVIRTRDNSAEYLPEDVSIIIGHNKSMDYKEAESGIYMINEYNSVNFNFIYRLDTAYLPSILKYLDPSIEYIDYTRGKAKILLKLKFYDDPEEIILNNPGELESYVSSGTIKGITLLTGIIRILQTGGYYFIDEIENHFNQELVASIVRLFSNKRTNPNGATIIFTTHYPELLDDFTRNDNIYITRRNNKGIEVTNLSSELKRTDIKRSEIFQSDYLKGTAPSYNAYMNLRNSIIKFCEERADVEQK